MMNSLPQFMSNQVKDYQFQGKMNLATKRQIKIHYLLREM
jgi:hypothetical protein